MLLKHCHAPVILFSDAETVGVLAIDSTCSIALLHETNVRPIRIATMAALKNEIRDACCNERLMIQWFYTKLNICFSYLKPPGTKKHGSDLRPKHQQDSPTAVPWDPVVNMQNHLRVAKLVFVLGSVAFETEVSTRFRPKQKRPTLRWVVLHGFVVPGGSTSNILECFHLLKDKISTGMDSL